MKITNLEDALAVRSSASEEKASYDEGHELTTKKSNFKMLPKVTMQTERI